MAKEGVDLVVTGYEAFNRRDWDAVMLLLDEAIVYRMPMDPLQKRPVFRGHAGVREFYGLLEAGFAEFRAQIDSIRDLGEVISVTGRLIGRPTAAPEQVVTTRFAHFWTVREGKAVDVAFHDADNPFSLLEGG